MLYICPKKLCALYSDCPLKHGLEAAPSSQPDENTGEQLYFAVCNETGETFVDLHLDQLTEPERAPDLDAENERRHREVLAKIEELRVPTNADGLPMVVVGGVTKEGAKQLKAATAPKPGPKPKDGKSAKGLTQGQVGAMFEETEDVVSAWERGITPPPKTDDGELEYCRKMREDGDIKSLERLSKDWKRHKKEHAYIDSKRKQSFNEDIAARESGAVRDALTGMRNGDTPLGDTVW